MEEQIKSKERVAEHGEVFTNTREVNAMLDMVQSESERIDSRFLEPACGTGNFLAEVLRRKLVTVKRQYGKFSVDYEKYSVQGGSGFFPDVRFLAFCFSPVAQIPDADAVCCCRV